MPIPVATTDPAVLDAPAPGCDACPHPEADHDAVGLRYCRATVASALERGCICATA